MDKVVSVVIPARDSEGTICETIDSLAAQTRRPDEVIVVVGCSDQTCTAIEDYIATGFVRVLEKEPPADFVRDAHWKRWVGAKAATGNVLFFTDSKSILEEHAIQRALGLMDEHDVSVVAGTAPAWPNQASHFMAKIQDKGLVQNNPKFPKVGFLTRENFGRTESLPVTGALVMTRQAFECIQDDFGVRFSIVASTYDDYVTGWLLVKSGFTILTTNKVVAYHRHRLTWKSYTTQISRSGQSAAVLVRQYPDCPFGKRRLMQVAAVWGLAALGLTIATAAFLVFGSVAVLAMFALVISGFFTLGVANAIKARDIWGFLIPPVTTLLIFTFATHFSKGWVRRGRLASHEAVEYLQIR